MVVLTLALSKGQLLLQLRESLRSVSQESDPGVRIHVLSEGTAKYEEQARQRKVREEVKQEHGIRNFSLSLIPWKFWSYFP